MKVLLTNDDGFHANGIKVLKEIVMAAGIASEIWVVAPLSNCSGCGRSVGLRHAIEVYKVSDTEFIVNSTPSTTMFLGLKEIVGEKPDLVLSGINSGVNIGNDVTYSGTIAAAVEAAMMSIPSIAISQEYDGRSGEINWENPRKFLKGIVDMLLGAPSWDKSTVMSVNFPLISAKGIKFTSQGKYMPYNKIEKKKNAASSISYTIHRTAPDKDSRGESDDSIRALDDGYVTITPLKFDMTDFDILESLMLLNEGCNI
ncbi:5'/3'-nucleotidase SurE [Ehrlichia chaffeensis]|uniref:5'/3'-nucleotidase SurE n=1 Tax=Ehrlichia chaffeensis TaxID=945 RepID=UPI000444BC84|nr:5'/3'-nucleotidase SurE [Ehrlichia chaffeensis]AHX09128.1 5'/3'-nucleotidase SurE [Ehrlichia chaffeensis str. Wakulla]